MIGGLNYYDFVRMWRKYENKDATTEELNKAWADWSRQHTKG